MIRVTTHWKSSWTDLGCKVRRRRKADLQEAGGPRIMEEIELSCPYAEQPLAVEEHNYQTYPNH